MKLSEAGLNGDRRFLKLADIADQAITILAEHRGNESEHGRYSIWDVELNDGTEARVCVNSGNIPDRTVHQFFQKYPNEQVQLIVFMGTSNRTGNPCWQVRDVDDPPPAADQAELLDNLPF